MTKLRFNLVVGAVLLACGSALAQTDELFVPTTSAELAQLQASSDYFIKKHSYFATRYRIVRVNAELLRSADEVQMTLFDGLTLKVAREELEDHPGKYFSWSGTIIEPAYGLESFRADDRSEAVAQIMHSTAFSINLSAVSYDRELGTGAVFESHKGFTRPLASAPEPPVFRESAFYEVYGDIAAPTLTAKYRLRSLEWSPEYHILYEMNPRVIYPGGEVTDVGHRSRRQKHEEFLQSLGEDPRRVKMNNRADELRQSSPTRRVL